MFPNLTDRLHGHLHQRTFKQHASKKLASFATRGTDHRLLHAGNQIKPTAGSTDIGHDIPTMNRTSHKQQSFQKLGTTTTDRWCSPKPVDQLLCPRQTQLVKLTLATGFSHQACSQYRRPIIQALLLILNAHSGILPHSRAMFLTD